MTRAPEVDAKAISREEGIGSAALWFAVLGAPVAWVVHLVSGYSLEEWFACSPSNTAPGEVLGLSVNTVALIITIACGLVAASAGLVAWRCWRRAADDGAATAQRVRWMAIVGLMNSGLYLLAILGGLGPALILDVCEVSP